jgi:hypothetical protein
MVTLVDGLLFLLQNRHGGGSDPSGPAQPYHYLYVPHNAGTLPRGPH